MSSAFLNLQACLMLKFSYILSNYKEFCCSENLHKEKLKILEGSKVNNLSG